jgi:5-methylcytosine-specific restriction endonuclease McrA
MSKDPDEYYVLDPAHTDPKRMKKEREKAQKLKQSSWWRQLVAKGICSYCGEKKKPTELTMDHVVPIARGGVSVPSNIVIACKSCNQNKKLKTPMDELFKQLEKERIKKESEN